MNPSQRNDDAMHALVAPHALLPTGWKQDVLLVWDAAGTLSAVAPDAAGSVGVPRAPGVIVPGMPNVHAHAFQRAFAGLAEYRGASDDGFWSWRDHMYRFAAALTPDALEDIATHLYVEMLRAGYTSVCEFHYVHHRADGRPHPDAAEMALCIASAAQRAGIGLTLLPVLYQDSGFGGKPALAEQRRFINSVDGLLRIVERMTASQARVGVAPHSLRAVPPPALRDLVAGLHAIDPGAPVHIHIAEQQREVDDCLAWSGQRPVQWLLAHAPVDARWCLVHATHVDAAELEALARSRAVVGLCPSTEANLGDGVFPAAAFLDAGGAFGIGSDSHASVDPAEELRLLEYGQRLTLQRRNVLARAGVPEVAQRLWCDAVSGGACAASRPIAGLAVGQRADFIVLGEETDKQGLTPAQLLSGHVFAHHPGSLLREVWVGGRRCVQDDRHALAATARERFHAARSGLLGRA